MKDLAKKFEGLLWKITAVSSIIGALVFVLYALFAAESAVQEAAGAGLAMSFAVIPYVLAKAASEVARD